jgi:hypothetical protein
MLLCCPSTSFASVLLLGAFLALLQALYIFCRYSIASVMIQLKNIFRIDILPMNEFRGFLFSLSVKSKQLLKSKVKVSSNVSYFAIYLKLNLVLLGYLKLNLVRIFKIEPC